MDNASQSFTTWVIVTLGGGLTWVVRRVLTSQRAIELLEAEISRREDQRSRDDARRDKLRDEDREMVKDISRKVDALYGRGLK